MESITSKRVQRSLIEVLHQEWKFKKQYHRTGGSPLLIYKVFGWDFTDMF